MLTTITHGIVDCDAVPFAKTSTNVTINVVNRNLSVAIPHLQRQYLHVETRTLTNAWTDVTDNCWLSINIDRLGNVTYAVIDSFPVISAGEPALAEFWFDTNVNCWKRRIAPTMFINVIMCVVAKVVGGVVLPFRNSYIEQVFGATPPLTPIGEIVYDSSTQKPIVTATPERYFVTTVDNVKSRVMSSVDVNLANQTVSCIAAGAIPAYSAVVIEEFGSASVSPSVVSVTRGLIGIITSGATLGDVVDVHLTGLITNVTWDWSVVGPGVPLYVGLGGQLTAVKPNPNANQVARTVDRNTVVFEQPGATIVNNGGGNASEPIQVNLGVGRLINFVLIQDEFIASPMPVRLDGVSYNRGFSNIFFEPKVLYTTIQDQIISNFGNSTLTHFGVRPLGTCTINSSNGIIASNSTSDDVFGVLRENQIASFDANLHVFRACYVDLNLASVRSGLDVVTGSVGFAFSQLPCFNNGLNTINVTQVDHYTKVGGFGIGLGTSVNGPYAVSDFDPTITDQAQMFDFYVELTHLPVAHNNPAVGESRIWWYIPGIVVRKRPTIGCLVSTNQGNNIEQLSDVEFGRDVLAIYPSWRISPDGQSIEYIDFKYPTSAFDPIDIVSVTVNAAVITIVVNFDEGLTITLEFDTTDAVGDRLFVHEILRGEGLGV